MNTNKIAAMKKAFLILVAAWLSVQCSKESDAAKVKLELVPKRPIVIDADFTYTDDKGTAATDDDEEVTVKGPWFNMSYTATNDTDRTVTIVTLKITAKGYSSAGALVTFTYDLDPGDLDPEQSFLMEIGPGASFNGVTSGHSWFVDGLPDSSQVKSFIFSLEIEAVGWFGTSDNPEKSFRRTIFATTSF